MFQLDFSSHDKDFHQGTIPLAFSHVTNPPQSISITTVAISNPTLRTVSCIITTMPY